MRLLTLFSSCVTTFVWICVCCNATPVRNEQSGKGSEITTGTTPSLLGAAYGGAPSLSPRVPNQFFRYKVVALTQGAFIIPAPLTQVMRVADNVQNSVGPWLYQRLRDAAHENWAEWANQIHLKLGFHKFHFEIYTKQGHTIPLDFFDRFCETMILWATNGFFTLYNVVLRDIDAGNIICVKLTLTAGFGDEIEPPSL